MACNVKVDAIRRVVRLRQMVQRWRSLSLSLRRSHPAADPDPAGSSRRRRIPSGYLAVYVGDERRRFVIPTRYLRLPIFSALLHQAEEEFGFGSIGGLALPCEVGFFEDVLRWLERDEERFGRLGIVDFLRMMPAEVDVGFDSCKESTSKAAGTGSGHLIAPLLDKARV